MPRVCRATRNLLGAAGASITLENSTPHRVTLSSDVGLVLHQRSVAEVVVRD
jgi:hypothetical protein